jgi:hypothetical protein
VKSFQSRNGNIIRKMIEDEVKENKGINLKNRDENNLFSIIVHLFNKLFEEFSLFCYDDIYSETKKRRVNELLLVVGISCFNFFCGEDCPFNFCVINESIKSLYEDCYFEKEKKLYDEFENSINNVRNCSILKGYFNYQSYFCNNCSNKASSLFNYLILEKIIENTDSMNIMNISFSTDIEIVINMDFLLNNPNIQSIFFLPIRSSLVSIKSLSTFNSKKKKSDYKFYDEKFCFYILFYSILFY